MIVSGRGNFIPGFFDFIHQTFFTKIIYFAKGVKMWFFIPAGLVKYYKIEFYQDKEPVFILSIKGNYLRHRV